MDSKYRKFGLDANGTSHVHHRLITLISERQPYLENEITLFCLVDILNVPPNYRSQVIKCAEDNFFSISTDIGLP